MCDPARFHPRIELPAAFDHFAARAGGSAALMFSLVEGRPGIVGGAIYIVVTVSSASVNRKTCDGPGLMPSAKA